MWNATLLAILFLLIRYQKNKSIATRLYYQKACASDEILGLVRLIFLGGFQKPFLWLTLISWFLNYSGKKFGISPKLGVPYSIFCPIKFRYVYHQHSNNRISLIKQCSITKMNISITLIRCVKLWNGEFASSMVISSKMSAFLIIHHVLSTKRSLPTRHWTIFWAVSGTISVTMSSSTSAISAVLRTNKKQLKPKPREFVKLFILVLSESQKTSVTRGAHRGI